ncbi:Mor transcription activator family protein [Pseudorhodobacter sp.]|uniref:Mor transcription activator family protein n=1 Tax=Pseudorhodobacter sp. TaxID=1934400 RepID=UPI0026482C9F|nr:Mor transcription activator family protein [Pseudorhodobacter sp.]MDN5785730.1 helix-turn-helix domain-containing protein [Pseudorhodobacter sp.]
MKHVPVIANDLPLSLIDMVETLDEFHGAGLGMRAALKLMQAFGGLDLKFPKSPAPDHPVAVALGMDDALALCQHFGGNQIYVPKPGGRRRPTRRKAVLALQDQGRSRAEIARALGLSERHVRHLANTEPELKTLPLFPDE